jgi:hypothetical protein
MNDGGHSRCQEAIRRGGREREGREGREWVARESGRERAGATLGEEVIEGEERRRDWRGVLWGQATSKYPAEHRAAVVHSNIATQLLVCVFS